MSSKENKKDCTFQYGLGNPPLGQSVIVENTKLITLKEAKNLWNKYLPDFISRLEEGDQPQMAIWVDMKNDTDYHTEKYELDSRDNLKVVRGKLFKVTETEVKEL